MASAAVRRGPTFRARLTRDACSADRQLRRLGKSGRARRPSDQRKGGGKPFTYPYKGNELAQPRKPDEGKCARKTWRLLACAAPTRRPTTPSTSTSRKEPCGSNENQAHGVAS